MTSKEALKIIETYNYYKGAEDTTGNICCNLEYLEAKRNYDKAVNQIEKELKILEIIKTKNVLPLGQLEEIEEELGIDLIIKDKVEKNCYVFVGYQNSIEINQVEIKKYDRLGIYIYDKNAVFKYNYLPYKDYGKTWALTKEELNNDK